MSGNLITVVNHCLPQFGGLNYNSERRMFFSSGYTSQAGNTYFQGLRLSNRLAIVEDIGQGYYHTFLNGLKLYCYDGNQMKLIATRYYNCCYYSEYIVKQEAESMLKDYIKSQAIMLGAGLPDGMLNEYVNKQVAMAVAG